MGLTLVCESARHSCRTEITFCVYAAGVMLVGSSINLSEAPNHLLLCSLFSHEGVPRCSFVGLGSSRRVTVFSNSLFVGVCMRVPFSLAHLWRLSA